MKSTRDRVVVIEGDCHAIRVPKGMHRGGRECERGESMDSV